MTMPTTRDGAPARIPWPPILIALTFAAGRALESVAPVLPAPSPLAQAAGGVVAALAVLNDLWCASTLWRNKTTIMPHRAASTLATDGPYRYSRNPIYVSHVALTFGLGLWLGSTWVAALTPLLAYALQKLAIEPEERHLARRFGPDFAAYVARTRRWL